MPTGTAKSRLARSRARLAALLDDRLDDPSEDRETESHG
jgi:DNA-directed RNA polymerase specialized sigma24 family protein